MLRLPLITWLFKSPIRAFKAHNSTSTRGTCPLQSRVITFQSVIIAVGADEFIFMFKVRLQKYTRLWNIEARDKFMNTLQKGIDGAGVVSDVLASCRGGLSKCHLFAIFPFRNVKCGAVRIKTLNYPSEKKSVTVVVVVRQLDPHCIHQSWVQVLPSTLCPFFV